MELENKNKMEKSANKRWKESGTSLSFKEWIDRENKKEETDNSTFIPFIGENRNFASLDAVVPDISSATPDISSISTTIQQEKAFIQTDSGFKNTANNSNVLGLNKGILLFSGAVIAGSLGLYFYYRFKQRK